MHETKGHCHKDGKNTSSWFKSNFLEGNLSKYDALIATKGSAKQTINIDRHTIQPSDGLQLLGTVLDRKLHFSEHISNAMKVQQKNRGNNANKENSASQCKTADL